MILFTFWYWSLVWDAKSSSFGTNSLEMDGVILQFKQPTITVLYQFGWQHWITWWIIANDDSWFNHDRQWFVQLLMVVADCWRQNHTKQIKRTYHLGLPGTAKKKQYSIMVVSVSLEIDRRLPNFWTCEYVPWSKVAILGWSSYL